jgi:uncharacterized membrane protein YidH (DUF202 family)
MIILLIVYGVFLLGLAIFGSSAVYHALRFGFPGDNTKPAVFIYLALVTIIVVASFILIGTVDFARSQA